jgi:hypothetical protein
MIEVDITEPSATRDENKKKKHGVWVYKLSSSVDIYSH